MRPTLPRNVFFNTAKLKKELLHNRRDQSYRGDQSKTVNPDRIVMQLIKGPSF